MTLLVLDPGHGGEDPGAVFGKDYEKYFNLKIALRVRDYLLSMYHVNIVMTRARDKTMSLKERTDLANEKKADYFCSIHINAGGGTGWESYIYKGKVSEITKRYRDTIHDEVMEKLKKYRIVDRGKKAANFHVLRETVMPALLIENLFLDTEEDLAMLKNNAFINDLAEGLGEGLAKALSLKKMRWHKIIAGSFKERLNAEQRQKVLSSKGIESIVLEAKVQGEKWYRVQAGAFLDKDNAASRMNKIKEIGITDAFIISE